MHRFSALFVALALPWLAATPASSAVIHTILPADAPDHNLADGICDADAGNDLVVDPDPEDPDVVPVGQCTLRAAIQTANAEAGPDTIKLRGTFYVLSLTGPGEDEAATGDLDITSDITIDGAGYQVSRLDGKKLKDRIFDVHPGGALTLDQASLLFGKTPKPELEPGGAGAPGSGGCLRSAGAVDLDEVFFSSCTASTAGGCMNVLDDTATISDTVFASCRAGTEGGGLSVAAGGAASLARVTAGVCRAATGGAIATRGALTLSNTAIALNKGKQGGGVAVLGDGTATIANSTIASNSKTNLVSQTTGLVTVSSSIVAEAKTDCIGPVSSGGGNLESGMSCAFTGFNDQQNKDPLLLPLAFYGGPIATIGLAEDSPAVDHGLDVGDACLDDVGDSRELLRVRSVVAGPALTDAGSFEVAGAPPTPSVSSSPDTSADVDAAYSYDVQTSFPERDVCRTFSLTTSPTGMTIDPASGLIAWTPTVAQLGANPVLVRVEDDLGGFTTHGFTVTVVTPAP